jgi:hypothetical protein
MTDELAELVAAALARAGFPRSRESARDYRLRLARAAIREVSKYEAKKETTLAPADGGGK